MIWRERESEGKMKSKSIQFQVSHVKSDCEESVEMFPTNVKLPDKLFILSDDNYRGN